MNSVIENIKNRRSIRRYTEKPVPKAVIESLLDAGIHAPSSHNSQPWNFKIITSQQAIESLSEDIRAWYNSVLMLGKPLSFIKKVKQAVDEMSRRVNSEKDLFFYRAPLVIIIHSKSSEMHLKDCACCSQNMMLAARSLGIGSCWIGFADIVLNKSRKLRKKLGIPVTHKVMATIAFGYTEKFPSNALPREPAAKDWIM